MMDDRGMPEHVKDSVRLGVALGLAECELRGIGMAERAAERRRRVVEMYRAGMTFAGMAGVMGVSTGRIGRFLRDAELRGEFDGVDRR